MTEGRAIRPGCSSGLCRDSEEFARRVVAGAWSSGLPELRDPAFLAAFARDQAAALAGPAVAAEVAALARAHADLAAVRAGEPLRLVGPPRPHGNGFAKVDLAGGGRLDVFRDDLPRQAVPTGIHDHDFSFCSAVLGGTLVHETYAPEFRDPPRRPFSPGSTVEEVRAGLSYHDAAWDVLRADCRVVGYCPSRPDGRRADLRLLRRLAVPAGRAYLVGHAEVHEVTHVGPTLTLLRKLDRAEKDVTIFVRRGGAPDNAFAARVDLSATAELVRRTLRLHGVPFRWEAA